MIIEVNLLPGRPARRASGTPSIGAIGQRLRGGVSDPYLAAAIVALLAAGGGIGVAHTTQSREADAIADRASAAVEDSTRYASVIAARKGALAERDSVDRQLAIITAIDSTRYVWAHVLDEVSQSLPAYTWLTSVQQTSPAPMPPGTAAASAPDKPADEKSKARADSIAVADSVSRATVRFRVVGQTVDIQALTTFMRELEGSPFVQRVQLAKSEAVIVDGRDVTEFTLDGAFEPPARELVRTRRLTVPLR